MCGSYPPPASPFGASAASWSSRTADIDHIDETDVAIVCDMYTPIDTPPHGRYGREIDWLKQVYAKGAILGSVCSGTLLLAEAGLLDGQEASGHWAYRELCRDHYPKVKLRIGTILSRAGDQDRIVTAGGANIVAGSGAISDCPPLRVPACDQNGQGAYPVGSLGRPVAFCRDFSPKAITDALIGECQSWIAEHYACDNPVAKMTDRSGLKPRTFARRFVAATGFHPVDYVHVVRIEEAKQLLETEKANVEEIGHTVGYEDPTFFRRLFKRKAGLTPGRLSAEVLQDRGAGVAVNDRVSERQGPQRAVQMLVQKGDILLFA